MTLNLDRYGEDWAGALTLLGGFRIAKPRN